MGAHALGTAAYTAKAAGLAARDEPDALHAEIRWQLARLSPEARIALRTLPLLGEDSAGPLGPGLLTRGIRASTIRHIQASLETDQREHPHPPTSPAGASEAEKVTT